MGDVGFRRIQVIMEQIDWEKARVQAAIAAMQGILANIYINGSYSDGYCTKYTTMSRNKVANDAVVYADALIKELKKEK